MSGLEIAGGIILLIACIGITVLVVLQSPPKSGGISALSGGDSFLNKNQGQTKDALLVKITKILAIALFVITIAVYTIISRRV